MYDFFTVTVVEYYTWIGIILEFDSVLSLNPIVYNILSQYNIIIVPFCN